MAKGLSLRTRLVSRSKITTRYRRQQYQTGGKNTRFSYVGGIPRKGGK